MSYPRDLDEIPTAELEAELTLRRQRLDAGNCDYCGRSGAEPACRFQDRHLAARAVLSARRADFIKSVENTPREF